MPGMQLLLEPTPDEETAAAIVAAVCSYIEQTLGDAHPNEGRRRAWSAAAVLAAQYLPPARNAAHTAWSAAERAARAERWSYGIVGT
jgi:hypothetical protein